MDTTPPASPPPATPSPSTPPPASRALHHRVPVAAGWEDDQLPGQMTLVDTGTQCRLVEYAPGQWCALLPLEEIPRFGVVRFMRQGSEWKPVLQGWTRYIQLAQFRPQNQQRAQWEIDAGVPPGGLAEHIGLDLSYNTVLRLYKNDFVRGCQPVPGRILIDLASLVEHIEATKDPDFWTADRREQFKRVIY